MLTKITQDDREMVALWSKRNGRHLQAANVRRGTADSTYLPQLFAAHRIAAYEAGRVAGLEEAAKVMEAQNARDHVRRIRALKEKK